MLAYVKAYYQPANSPARHEASGFFNFTERPVRRSDNANSYQARIDFNKSEKNFGFGRVSLDVRSRHHADRRDHRIQRLQLPTTPTTSAEATPTSSPRTCSSTCVVEAPC